MKAVFPAYDKTMKGVDWGRLHNECGGMKGLDPKKLGRRVLELMTDDEVTKKSGIYEYVLTGREKALNLRAFTESQRITMHARQNGICANKDCPQAGVKLDIGEMDADHIKPWSKGGKTDLNNGRMLCSSCNRSMGAR